MVDYFTQVVTSSLTGSSSSSGTEIDLREELAELLRGTDGSTPHGRTFILRRARRDAENRVINCSCVDMFTGESDKDTACKFCFGEKILFDEEKFIGYCVKHANRNASSAGIGTVENLEVSTDAGKFNLPGMTLYTEYFVQPTKEDIIVEIKLDVEGEPVSPIERIAKYKITGAIDLRSDNGRVEFYKLFCSRIYFNALEYGAGVTP